LVVIGAIAMMAFTAAAFQETDGFRKFTDAGAVAAGLEAHAGRAAGVMFALALLDASIIGAAAVSLSTAYAIGDLFAVRHSLHRRPTEARGFYLVYAGLIGLAALLVLFGSDSLLGLLTNAVQTLAGVLLPSATVFLLLLCNDKAVLGPWVNGRWRNLFTGAVIWVLVMLSIILTAATVCPEMSGETILGVLGGGTAVGLVAFGGLSIVRQARRPARAGEPANAVRGISLPRSAWRMPPLASLPAPHLTLATRLWMAVLRGYLVIAVLMVAYKLFQVACGL
ncbi:MAG TPA: divalent metal cation transporter, partial [Rhodopila sp.]|nr:divalent metal cation transporter [Rhodopila sp.]